MNFTTFSSNLQLAQLLAGRGWLVFPCRPDKAPKTKRGFRDATTDPGQLERWFKADPGALVGIACQASGFFALDLDRKPGGPDGLQSWAALVENYGGGAEVQAGPVQRTPSGGYHLLFEMPAGLKVPNNAGKLAPGIDLRSAGYICSGGAYQWQPDHGADSQLTPAPAWLLERIRTLSERPAPHPAEQPPAGGGSDPGGYWLDYYLQRAAPGARNEQGFFLACQLRDSGLAESQAAGIMASYAERVPGPDYTQAEALASLRSAYQASRREAAHLPGLASRRNGSGPAMPPSPPAFESDPAEVKLSSWADIGELLGPIEWAWPLWLPAGMLTILAGESGAGKSALALRLAGCFLRGDPWPDKSPFACERGRVLWAESEAAQAVNLDRAKKWGLPIDQILTPLDDPLVDFRLDAPAHLGALFQRAALPEVKFIVVDSLRGANSRDENSSELIGTVKGLAELARNTGKAVLLTHHLRKRGIFDGDSVDLDRLRGSSAIVQTARLVWALDIPDPGNRDWKRLQVVKSNLAKFPDPVGVTINESGVHFGLSPELPRVESVQDRAVNLLLALLQAGPQPASSIESEFTGAGISPASLRRAKARLNVISTKNREGWLWGLPQRGGDQ